MALQPSINCKCMLLLLALQNELLDPRQYVLLLVVKQTPYAPSSSWLADVKALQNDLL